MSGDAKLAPSEQSSDFSAPDRTSGTPLYLQIAQRIQHDIVTGVLRPGGTIGSEAELTKLFSVSRVTLRQAISMLADQGLVVRRHGKGTYVQAAPVNYPLDDLVGTTQLLSSQGRRWSSRVTTLRHARATAESAKFLRVRPGRRVTDIWRVDYAGEQPVAAAHIRLAPHADSGLTTDELERKPLYPLLEERTGIRADVAHETIRAASAASDIAALIGVNEGDPIMIVARVTHAPDGRPFEYSEIFFRADAVRFSISMRRAGTAEPYAIRFQQHRLSPQPSERIGL